MTARFTALCEELSRLQVRALRRDGNAIAIAMEAAQAIQANRDSIEPLRQNLPHVPLFLRSCATLLPCLAVEGARDALLSVERLAEVYVGGNHGDINDSAAVLQSLVQLSRIPKTKEECTDSKYTGVPFSSRSLVPSAFHNTLQKWRQHRVRPYTSSLLSLLRGTNAVHGSAFQFTPVGADIMGLLPIKSKLQMETKMQKCDHARDILKALCEMQFSRLDAGVCLTFLAECGFYNSDLCNICCEVLFSTHALMTSQQLAQIVYSLGVLQHRHIHQKKFSSLIDFKSCNTEALRQYVMGLAMLRQSPPSERRLLDGVFLHILRPIDPLGYSSSSEATLGPKWFVDVGHALTCLGITHYKYRLAMARTIRRDIISMNTHERCKFLYSLGGVSADMVPAELQSLWSEKVVQTIETLEQRLQSDVGRSDRPLVMHALLFAGSQEHPMIPQQPSLELGKNPVEVLLQTWATCPRERVLYLTEQIRPIHLGVDPATTLSQVCGVIANNCGAVGADSHHLGPLCDAISTHGSSMIVDDAMDTIEAVERMNVGERSSAALKTLLGSLWNQREAMVSEQRTRCCSLLKNLGRFETAKLLLDHMCVQ